MPFGYAAPNYGFGYQPTTLVPVQPSWIGPYYVADGSHVWHLSTNPPPSLIPPGYVGQGTVWGLPGDTKPYYQFARREGAKGVWSPQASAAQATSPNLWLRRAAGYGPIKSSMVGLTPGGTAPQMPIGLSEMPWEVMCTAPLGARQWSCPVRGTVYPPVPPTNNPSFGVSGHVGQFTPYAGPGYYWQQRQLAPYAGPGYHWGPPAQIPQPTYAPSALPAPPTPLAPCPPGYSWCPAQLVKKPNYSPWALGTGTGYDFYWPGGCCPHEPNSQFACIPGDMLDGKCVPPINTPPVYNPCQPGWNYNAAAKKCCPPGWHWSADFEQCVPTGSPKGY